MGDSKDAQFDESLDRSRSPKGFAEEFGVNLNNVYFWMRQHDLGRQDPTSRRWELSPQDQRRLLELREPKRTQPTARKRARSVQRPEGKRRKRGTEGLESIRVKLEVDEARARLIRILIEPGSSEMLFDLLETVCDYKARYRELFDHDRILLLVANLLGFTQVTALSPPDGYPSYKYIDTGDKNAFTLIYRIPSGVYFIETPAELITREPRLKPREAWLELSNEDLLEWKRAHPPHST